MSLRFAHFLIFALALLLFCSLLVVFPLSAATPPTPGEAIPESTVVSVELLLPEPVAVVSSSLSLPALYKATTLNVPAVYRLRSSLPPAPPPPSPKYTDLGTLGGPYSGALDVNIDSQVVGFSTLTADDLMYSGHAFLWQNGNMQDLGTLGGKYSTALRINDLGQVAGDSEYDASDKEHAFIWMNGQMTDIGTLGGEWSRVVDLNALGQVVGNSSTAAREQHCFLWAAGVMTDLGSLGGSTCDVKDINDRGVIVGTSSTGSPTHIGTAHAFVWAKGRMIDLTPEFGGDRESAAAAINEHGQVIGYRQGVPDSACGVGCPTLWDNGTITDLWYEGGGFSRMDAINDRGQIVGYGNYHPAGPMYGWYAELWDRGVLINLGLHQWSERFPNDPIRLNNRGQIVLGDSRLYLWQDGALIPFDSAGDVGARASAINDAGVVVGYRSTDVAVHHATLWQIASAAE